VDDEDNENGGFCTEPPSTSNVDEDYDDENRVESTSQKKRAPRKSKKLEAENGKSVQKRQRANEAADQSTKKPPKKKFSHSTRRNRGHGK
jgi:transcription factor TFIIIB component B''